MKLSGPLGEFYYQDLRDASHVIALAGGSGITPFYSMACAIADGELAKLNLKRRRIRKELAGEYGDPTADAAYPAQAAGKTYNVTVIIRGESQTVPCRADQTLLDALEKAGIRAPSHCRSGECGWCHSRLVAGDVYIPEDTDGRRAADKKFGWIHPCCSYPISDVTLDVPVIG